MRAKHLARVSREGIDPSSLRGEVLHYSIPVLEATGLPAREDASEIDSGKLIVRAGDVLVSRLNPRKSRVFEIPDGADAPTIASSEFVVFRPHSVHGPYLSYLMSATAVTQWLSANAKSATRSHQRVEPSAIADVEIPIRSRAAQVRIADYLDMHTAKIDALVGKQERLIETLAERRQAVISHAVTKGLDPNAPMKGSGVEWLGIIPKAWPTGHLRWFARSASGKSVEVEVEADAQNPYPAMGGNGVMGYTKGTNTSPGTLVVGRVGALCGNVHPILEPSWVTDNALYLAPGERFNPLYLLQLLRARRLNDIASKTAQPLITGTQLLDQTVPLPTMREQDEIVEYLDRETAQIDALSAKAREMIDVLKERRQALISAAVTGKIDVRGLA